MPVPKPKSASLQIRSDGVKDDDNWLIENNDTEHKAVPRHANFLVPILSDSEPLIGAMTRTHRGNETMIRPVS